MSRTADKDNDTIVNGAYAPGPEEKYGPDLSSGDSEHEVGIDLYRKSGDVEYTAEEDKSM